MKMQVANRLPGRLSIGIQHIESARMQALMTTLKQGLNR